MLVTATEGASSETAVRAVRPTSRRLPSMNSFLKHEGINGLSTLNLGGDGILECRCINCKKFVCMYLELYRIVVNGILYVPTLIPSMYCALFTWIV